MQDKKKNKQKNQLSLQRSISKMEKFISSCCHNVKHLSSLFRVLIHLGWIIPLDFSVQNKLPESNFAVIMLDNVSDSWSICNLPLYCITLRSSQYTHSHRPEVVIFCFVKFAYCISVSGFFSSLRSYEKSHIDSRLCHNQWCDQSEKEHATAFYFLALAV